MGVCVYVFKLMLMSILFRLSAPKKRTTAARKIIRDTYKHMYVSLMILWLRCVMYVVCRVVSTCMPYSTATCMPINLPYDHMAWDSNLHILCGTSVPIKRICRLRNLFEHMVAIRVFDWDYRNLKIHEITWSLIIFNGIPCIHNSHTQSWSWTYLDASA